MTGPSPRGWGERWDFRSAPNGMRTIPTRVGRTSWCARVNPNRADHPHAGGENGIVIEPVAVLAGPSPRGWGERAWLRQRRRCGRTIPTRVGRTLAGYGITDAYADHPHAGGENSFITTAR